MKHLKKQYLKDLSILCILMISVSLPLFCNYIPSGQNSPQSILSISRFILNYHLVFSPNVVILSFHLVFFFIQLLSIIINYLLFKCIFIRRDLALLGTVLAVSLPSRLFICFWQQNITASLMCCLLPVLLFILEPLFSKTNSKVLITFFLTVLGSLFLLSAYKNGILYPSTYKFHQLFNFFNQNEPLGLGLTITIGLILAIYVNPYTRKNKYVLPYLGTAFIFLFCSVFTNVGYPSMYYASFLLVFPIISTIQSLDELSSSQNKYLSISFIVLALFEAFMICNRYIFSMSPYDLSPLFNGG